MAHQVSSTSLGSSSMHQGMLASAPPSANQTHLDLNLSQKASQNPFKGHDEPENSHQKDFESLRRSQPDSVPKTVDVVTSNANGSISKQGGAHSPAPQQKRDADSATGARTTPSEPSHNSITGLEEEGLPVINEPAPSSVGRKRKSPRVEAVANAQKELQSATAVLDYDSMPGNGPEVKESTCKTSVKRKSPRVKQATADTTKKVILALEANEDEGLAKPKGRYRGSSDLSRDVVLHTPQSRSKSLVVKGDASNLAERRLSLEERKLRLAEQRFALEEKKLDATIEIGKGLIISMERMTNTISNLGNSSGRH